MSSETTPHTLQQEHYSVRSKLEANFFPGLMIAFGLAGIYAIYSSMI